MVKNIECSDFRGGFLNSTESNSCKTADDMSGETNYEVVTMQDHVSMDATSQLSIAKITGPHLTDVFQRDRLFSLLDRASERSVIWVCAPAGSGKTTLVASWLAARRQHALWYQVDEVDADPASLFYYMGLAAEKTVPHHHRALPLFTPEYLLELQAFTRRYFKKLFSLLKTPCTIVFDNYQEASLESLFHEVIRDGVSVAPSEVTIIFISRNIPPAIMAPLKAKRRLVTIDWEKIRLTLEETAGIAKLYEKDDVKDESIRSIHEMAQGWAAGVILMMECKPSHYNNDRFLAGKDSLTEVFDYFAEEIISKITPEIREFLLKSSLLPNMTAIMAERLTGFEGSERILSHLVRNNYFTCKHAHFEPVYQYHPLFREFLLSQATGAFPQEELTRIQRHAAALLVEKGEVEAALALLHEAVDLDGVTKLVLAQAHSLAAQGRFALLEAWLKAIPSQNAEEAVWPIYWLAVCRLPFDPMESRRLFERAFGLFRRYGDIPGAILAWSGCVDTFHHLMDDFSDLDKWMEIFDAFLGNDPSFPTPEIEAHATAGIISALVYRQPSRLHMKKWLVRAMSLTTTISDTNLILRLNYSINNYYIWMGEFGNFDAILDQVGRIIRTKSVSPLTMISWKCLESSILSTSAKNNKKMMDAIEDGLKIAQESGVHLWDHMLFAHGVYHSFNTGDMAMAGDYLAKMAETINYRQRTTVGHLNFLQAWRDFLIGNPAQALVHVEKAVEMAVVSGTPVPETFKRVVKALILHKMGDWKYAETELSKIKALVRSSGSLLFEYVSLLTEAHFCLDSGRGKKGVDTLRKAMNLGRRQGYDTLIFWWLPKAMSRLCAIALEESIEIDYVRELIVKLNLHPANSHIFTDTDRWPWPIKIFTLGTFLLEKEGIQVNYSGKVQEKPLAVLKAITALGGREVSEEKLSDLLWPNADGDAAYHSLATNLHRLRKLLGHDQALLVQGGRVTLNPQVVWVDALVFDGLTRENFTLGCPERLMKKAMTLYGGHFLVGDKAEHWAVSMRERLRSKFLGIVAKEGARLEVCGELEKAIDCYQKGLEIDDLIEEFYQRLMVCYSRLGKRGNVLSLYRRCSIVLAMLGLKPSAVTRSIYAEVAAAPDSSLLITP
jgi:LuxR family transcriptional regulator, maltose regulon positive regulatory protein